MDASAESGRVPSALVLGGQGRLGRALVNELLRRGFAVHTLEKHKDSDCLTVFSAEELTERVTRLQPQYVFNAMAWTDIDAAEANPEAAAAVNTSLPALIGRVLRGNAARLVHFSTSYVFDGRKGSPYTERDIPNPISVYGQTKLDGERELLNLNLPGCLIIRGAWLFGPGGDSTVAKLLTDARTNTKISMAHDFVGSPTYTPDMAFASVELAQRGASGLFNVANSGQASLCEFAAEAVRLANLTAKISAHTRADVPDVPPRPMYSVLDCTKYMTFTGLSLRPWAQALRELVYSMFLETD